MPDKLLGTRVGEHPRDLGVEVFPQFVGTGQSEQFFVRHRRPEEVRQPRRQRIFINQRITLGRARGGRFLAKQKRRGRQHRRHRLGDAGLERLPFLRRDTGGKLRQPIDGFLGYRPPKRLGGEALQQLTGILTAIVGACGHVLREETRIVLRPDPILFVQRTSNGDRLDPDRERADLFFGRRLRLQLERELMFAGLPVLIDHVVIGPPILPAVFPRQAFPAVDLDDQPAAVEVKDAIHESLVGRQVHDKLIAAGMLDANRARNHRWLVIRQRQRPFVVPGGRGSAVAPKSPSGDRLLRDGCRARRHGRRHDRLGRRDVLLQQQGRKGEDVADIVESMPRVIGGNSDVVS